MDIRPAIVSCLACVLILVPAARSQDEDRWQDQLLKLNYTPADVKKLDRNKVLLGKETYAQVFVPYIDSRQPVFITSDSLLNACHKIVEECMRKERRLKNGFKDIPKELKEQYIACLGVLKQKEVGQPSFVHNTAWGIKTRQTLMASLVQAKHKDARLTVLDVDLQPNTTVHTGFVEPAPEFFAQMTSLMLIAKEKFKDVLHTPRYEVAELLEEIEAAKKVAQEHDLYLRQRFNVLTPQQIDLLRNPVLSMACASVRSNDPINETVASELKSIEEKTTDRPLRTCFKSDEYSRFIEALSHSSVTHDSDKSELLTVLANKKTVEELSTSPCVRTVVEAAIENLESGKNQRKDDMVAAFDEVRQEIVSGNWEKAADSEAKLHLINAGLRAAIQSQLKPDDFESVYDQLTQISTRLEEISRRQLSGATVTAQDGDFISNYGKSLASAMFYRGTSYSIPLDDAPRIVEMSPHKEPPHKESAIGEPRSIYVLYPSDGKEVLSVGAVMPYYEFFAEKPRTDTEWMRKLHEAAPSPPGWLKPLLPSAR